MVSESLFTSRKLRQRDEHHDSGEGASVSSIEPPPSPPPAEAQEPERLYHAKESYNEVLDATKHQDDKIGRFLTGIAFLIAGSLVFTSPEVLQARYAVGSTHLRLPAIALITFLVLVVFSVLLYVLAMAAPLTTPSPPAARRSRHRSHLFFLLIARETQESWDQLWKNTTVEELQRDLLVEYLSETRNIAQRADEKYERSNEASAVFVVALLFFLLGTVFSVDVLQHAKPPTGATLQVPTELNWSAPLRATVAIILALFAAVLVYFRLRAAQTRRLGELTRPERKWSDGWSALHVLLLMYPVVRSHRARARPWPRRSRRDRCGSGRSGGGCGWGWVVPTGGGQAEGENPAGCHKPRPQGNRPVDLGHLRWSRHNRVVCRPSRLAGLATRPGARRSDHSARPQRLGVQPQATRASAVAPEAGWVSRWRP
jgi:hypothetical protein